MYVRTYRLTYVYKVICVPRESTDFFKSVSWHFKKKKKNPCLLFSKNKIKNRIISTRYSTGNGTVR